MRRRRGDDNAAAVISAAATTAVVALGALALLLLSRAAAPRVRSSFCRPAALCNNPPARIDMPYRPLRLHGVLEPADCAALVRAAEGRVTRSTTLAGVVADRTSSHAWLTDDEPGRAGAAVARLRALGAALTGILDSRLYERVQVARYDPGQEYRAHLDACVTDARCAPGGPDEPLPRRATLLVYLSDGFGGGHTHFPRAGVSVAPSRGDAVFFYNTSTSGEELAASLHAGQPVVAAAAAAQAATSSKWIATLWVRYPTKA